MEKPRFLIAIVLSVGFLFFWNKYFSPKPPVNNTPEVQQTTPSTTSKTDNQTIQSAQSNVQVNVDTNAISTEKTFTTYNLGPFELGLSNYLGEINHFQLKVNELSKLDIQSNIDFIEKFNLKLFNSISLGEIPFIGNWTQDNNKLIFLGSNSFGKIQQVLSMSENYTIDVENYLTFNTNKPKFMFLEHGYLGLGSDTSSFFGNPYSSYEEGIFYSNSDLEELTTNSDFKEGFEGKTQLEWFGLNTRYFAILTDLEMVSNQVIRARALEKDSINVVQSGILIDQKENLTLNYKIFAGPKIKEDLVKAKKAFTETMGFGVFSPIAFPLLSCLKFFYNIVTNYGISIILLTLLVKILTFPLAYKGVKGMKKMSKIQPLLQEIRAKFKDDPMKMNQETMKLMKDHKANPFGSCLIMFIQIPIFFALYRVLLGSIELYGAPFYGWIHDLTLHDPYYVFPILVGIAMFVQQKMTPTPGMDPTQQKILQFMPLMFMVFMLNMPAGLSVYMLVNSIFSILQQWYFNKKFV